MRSVRVSAAFAAVAAICLASGVASAQQGTDVATAQALFEDGKALMQQKKYDEACPKLVESERLDPGGGTVLAIALCHEAQGKTATAWADFESAMSAAHADRRPDREHAAQQHAAALEKRLVRIRLVVPAAVKVDGLEVRRDGALVGEAQWGTPVPIDPGEHSFAANAPKKIGWSKVATIDGEGQTIDVEVPPLADAPAPVVAPVPTATDASPNAVALPPPVVQRSFVHKDNSAQKPYIVGSLVAGGIGVVGLGLGVGFGISAITKWNTVKNECPSPTHCNNTEAPDQEHGAGHSADASTVSFVVGGAGLIASGLIYFLRPDDESRTGWTFGPMIGNGATGMSAGRSF